MISISQPFLDTHLLKPECFEDNRGNFVKTFQSEFFSEIGIHFQPVEEFYSTSRKGVLRGMHFQLPPHDHDKLVYCIRGRVMDVLLDLRKSSPTYGRSFGNEISANNHLMFYIPKGVAHGFLSLEDDSVLVYKTTTIHFPSHDAGVRWDSFGYIWPDLTANSIISPRDCKFPSLEEFKTPFP